MRLAAALKVLTIALILMQLQACGFHFRGAENTASFSQELSFSLKSASKKLQHELVQAAINQNIQLAANSDWQLSIVKEEFSSVIIGKTISRKFDQSRLQLFVSYQWQYKNQNLKPQILNTQAVFENNSDQALSKAQEQQRIQQQLRQQMAELLIAQLQQLAANPPQCDCDEAQ